MLTFLHIGNAFYVLVALLLVGVYGGLAGAIGMKIADILESIYIVGDPKINFLCVVKIISQIFSNMSTHSLRGAYFYSEK